MWGCSCFSSLLFVFFLLLVHSETHFWKKRKYVFIIYLIWKKLIDMAVYLFYYLCAWCDGWVWVVLKIHCWYLNKETKSIQKLFDYLGLYLDIPAADCKDIKIIQQKQSLFCWYLVSVFFEPSCVCFCQVKENQGNWKKKKIQFKNVTSSKRFVAATLAHPKPL